MRKMARKHGKNHHRPSHRSRKTAIEQIYYTIVHFLQKHPIIFAACCVAIAVYIIQPTTYERDILGEANDLILSPVQTFFDFKPYEMDIEASRSALLQLNSIRVKNGLKPLSFDERAYRLALDRAKDMSEYQYLDHVNPYTGSYPDGMKKAYGFSSGEYVAENCYGKATGPYNDINQALSSWMESRGHRFNLMYPNHTGGAIACYDGYWVFLGVNSERFGEGKHTAAEGLAYWNTGI